MDEQPYVQQLEARGIRPTALRLLAFKTMTAYPQAFSLSNLEEALDTVDKSTLFRTITLFHKQHLIHSIDDGSGSIKYSVCSSDCMCRIKDLHAHFSCNKCRRTFCMKTVPIPDVELPQKFILSNINFVLKGLCDKCSGKM
ncbi:MAG: transcriptional repressor [Prevotellaceae bacterium]|jgi:Fur family ferric uptake transcriptional regulator|nr:transcriptional repressor [Prevotellaceae bacterium]